MRKRGSNPKVCTVPGCPNLDCKEHERPAWRPREDNRRYQLSGWERSKRRKRVLARHRGICHVCGGPGATEADHVIPLTAGGPDTEANMRPIHAKPCHKNKTAREAQR